MNKKDYILPNLKEAARRNRNEIKNEEFSLPEDLKEFGKGKKYYIRTHGCQANQRDSETMAGILEAMGYKACEEYEDADVILLNTCAIRQNAEEKVYGEIGALKKLKREKPDLVIGVGGCMSQEEEVVRTLVEKYPQVDIIFGTHNITSLARLVQEASETKKRRVEVYSAQGEIYEKVPVTRFMHHKAWVNVMYGCDKFCTYCIVPYTRGRERSRFSKDIIEEVETLVREGYKEVCLLGQNVNAYGKDLNIPGGFGTLLSEVADTGIERIRFMTSHPWDFDEGMIKAMKTHPNIMPYLHLPVQSGDDEILKKMNRRYSVSEYKELFDRIRSELPHYAVTTDIIVGFPNESDEAFQHTLDLVDYCRYDNAFTFIYSPREGTPAARMEDHIPMSVKEERLQILNGKIAEYARFNNQKFLNKDVKVLADGLSKRNSSVYSGYTPENKLVNFTGEDIRIGEIVDVHIDEAMSFSLNGHKIEK